MAVSGGRVIAVDSVTSPVLVQAGTLIITAVRAAEVTGLGAAFVQLFDAASVSDVTLGTTPATWWVHTTGGGEISVGDGLPQEGVTFQKGLVIASTTTHNGSTTRAQHVRVTIG